MQTLALTVLAREYSIHRFETGSSIPAEVLAGGFYSLTATDDELSFVCESGFDIEASETNSGWSCIKVLGPLDFSLTGILAGISSVLAKAEISIFAISTFDTDYILVKTENLNTAREVLSDAGYKFS